MTSYNNGSSRAVRSGDPKYYESYQAELASSAHGADGLDLCPLPPQRSNISIAVDPVALITTECITVTSVMRKHTRWAQSSVSAILGGGGAMSAGRDMKGSLRPNDTSASSQLSPGVPKKTGNSVRMDDGSLASRWGLRGKKGKSMQDNPLMSAFARLRSDLRGCKGQ